MQSDERNGSTDESSNQAAAAAASCAVSFEGDEPRAWSPDMLVRVVTSDIEEFSFANESGIDGIDLDDDEKMFFSLESQPFSMEFYVDRLVTYCNCSTSAFVVALAYLDKVQVKCRALSLTQQNCHRLLSTALLLAIKFLDDEVCKQDFYAQVFGLNTEELNQLELTMLKLLDWNLFFDHNMYNRYEDPLYRAENFLREDESPERQRA